MLAKKHHRPPHSTTRLFVQMATGVTVFCILLIGITIAITIRVSLSTFHEQIESVLQSTGDSLAQSEMVRQALLDGRCSDELIEYLDLLVKETGTLDVVTIANAQSVRIYHVTHERITEEFVGGDQGRVLTGESYFSDAIGTMGPQHRYFTPVYDDGNVIGFVMASATMNLLDELRYKILMLYSRMSLILLLLTLAVCGLIVLLVRHALHGFDPSMLVHGYLTQNDLLNNLDEGVISVDESGTIQLANRAAEEMLGQQADILEGQLLDELIRDKIGGSLLNGPRRDIPTSHPNILASSIPLVEGGHRKGTTLILTDRTEAMRVAEQLNGTRHIVSALRANTHEFMNKLQVISGLLVMGRINEASDYIDAIANSHAKAAAPILRYIQNPSVAALLLGKHTHMREQEIDMTLLANSRLPKHSEYLTTNELITVIGNLLENAIEALKVQTNGPANIVLQITEDETGLLIAVSDTGCGISPEDMKHLYEPGFSTKAQEGRGMGMFLIRETVDRRGGSIEVDSEPGTGTAFTLIFNQKREGRPVS